MFYETRDIHFNTSNGWGDVTPFYAQWAESQRLKQIQVVKQQARTVPGDRLETVLSKLESGEPPSLIVLYTGSTESHLEPCGCYQEQSGGLPRRAYAVEQIRERGIPTLLVDAGDIFNGREDIDTHRCKVNLKAMSTMGYDVVALSEADLSYGNTYLSRRSAVATFPFLAPDAIETDFTQPFVIDFRLQFIAQEKAEPSAQDITPFVSLHGYPEVAENIRQLLIAREYPDRYLDYILCRGKKLEKSWEDCAEKLGIDVAKIQELFDSPGAEQIFRENIRRAAELGIKASPTILLDTHPFRANQLLRASGTPCQ